MANPTTLLFTRGQFVNLPALRSGEPGFTTDRSDFFVGGPDGNKFFGSHRYWVRENATNAAEFKLVDKDGTNGVSLRSPATVTTPVTYTLPQGGGTSGQYLRLGSDGVLEWESVSEGSTFDNSTLSNTTFTGISTFSGLIDANEGLDVSGHTKIGETLEVVGVSTFTGAINADGGIVGDLTGNADTATALQNARDFDIIGSFVTAAAVSFDGTGNVSLAATITENSIELGTYTTGNYVADVSGTANEVTVSGSGEGASLTLGLAAEVIVGTSLTAPTVYAGSVKAVDGTDAITISNTTGNVAFASTVTIEGNLQVLGSTTTVNTETLLIKDPVIELGRVDDNGNLVPPSSTTATDLGLVFHYYDDAENSAETSAFYWDHTTERFALAATLVNYPATTGSIVANAFAALELSSLYISDCAGSAQQVFGCTNGEVTLLNTVIDCGSFDV